jgi:hypothetical protein
MENREETQWLVVEEMEDFLRELDLVKGELGEFDRRCRESREAWGDWLKEYLAEGPLRDQALERTLRAFRFKAAAESQVSAPERSVAHVPGARLAQIAESVFEPKFFERVMEPTLRDMAVEYTEALREGRQAWAGWVLMRGYGSFVWALLAQVPVSLARIAVALWRAVR